MAVKFFNIRSGETRTIDPSLIDPTFVEPAITALFNSGNLHVNATRGQDFGWRLAPETIKRIRDIKQDDLQMQRIAVQQQIPLENISETDVLTWIVKDDARKEALKNQQTEGDYNAQYEKELREIGVLPDGGVPSIDNPAGNDNAESEADLEAQAAAAAKANEKTPAQKKKEQEEEDRLMAELEAEEAEEKRQADEAAAKKAEAQAAAGSTQAPEKQQGAEENTPKAPEKVAKTQPKDDNKSNS